MTLRDEAFQGLTVIIDGRCSPDVRSQLAGSAAVRPVVRELERAAEGRAAGWTLQASAQALVLMSQARRPVAWAAPQSCRTRPRADRVRRWLAGGLLVVLFPPLVLASVAEAQAITQAPGQAAMQPSAPALPRRPRPNRVGIGAAGVLLETAPALPRGAEAKAAPNASPDTSADPWPVSSADSAAAAWLLLAAPPPARSPAPAPAPELACVARDFGIGLLAAGAIVLLTTLTLGPLIAENKERLREAQRKAFRTGLKIAVVFTIVRLWRRCDLTDEAAPETVATR